MSDDAGSNAETLRCALTEARRAFDKREELLESTDEKALATVRTATILVGLAVTAIGVSARGAARPISPVTGTFLALGLLSFGYAVLRGVQTYWTSEATVGVPRRRRQVPDTETPPTEFVRQLVESYDRRERPHAAVLRDSANGLARSLMGLTVGVGWYTMAGVSFSLNQFLGFPVVASLGVIPVVLLVHLALSLRR